jgi:hypothetical protein
VSLSCMQSCDFSHFLKILALGLGSLSSLWTTFPTRDCGLLWWRHSLWVLHIYSLSWGPDISGTPAISLFRSGLTMGVGPSKIPSDSPLWCLMVNLGPLHLTPDLKPQKLIFLCTQAWPEYREKCPLDMPPHGHFWSQYFKGFIQFLWAHW